MVSSVFGTLAKWYAVFIFHVSCFTPQVSATFAASLIVSPSLGAFLEKAYSENFVIMLASIIALADILFILFCVPESLNAMESNNSGSGPNRRPAANSPPVASNHQAAQVGVGNGSAEQGGGAIVEKKWNISWEKVDPFMVSVLCIAVTLAWFVHFEL